MSIRSCAKAIIIKEGKILLNRCRDLDHGDYFALPGGGQNDFETLEEAVVRECREEPGYEVKVSAFAALCEEICESPVYREKYPRYAHKMYHVFRCEIPEGEPEIPTETDEAQLSSEWVALEGVPDIVLYPKAVGRNLERILSGKTPLFLGSEFV